MRRRRKEPTFEDLPAELADFAPEAWTAPGDEADRAYALAHDRWWRARAEWAEERGMDGIDLMREDRRRRQAR